MKSRLHPKNRYHIGHIMLILYRTGRHYLVLWHTDMKCMIPKLFGNMRSDRYFQRVLPVHDVGRVGMGDEYWDRIVAALLF